MSIAAGLACPALRIFEFLPLRSQLSNNPPDEGSRILKVAQCIHEAAAIQAKASKLPNHLYAAHFTDDLIVTVSEEIYSPFS